MGGNGRYSQASKWDDRVGHYVVSKDRARPNVKQVVEVTRPGKLPSKPYPFRRGHGYSRKEPQPDCDWTRLVVRDTKTGYYSWPRPRDVWYIGPDPDGEVVLCPDPPIAKHLGKTQKLEQEIRGLEFKEKGYQALCEDLLVLFHHSHKDEYCDHEIGEVLAPYKERLKKLKEL